MCLQPATTLNPNYLLIELTSVYIYIEREITSEWYVCRHSQLVLFTLRHHFLGVYLSLVVFERYQNVYTWAVSASCIKKERGNVPIRGTKTTALNAQIYAAAKRLRHCGTCGRCGCCCRSSSAEHVRDRVLQREPDRCFFCFAGFHRSVSVFHFPLALREERFVYAQCEQTPEIGSV